MIFLCERIDILWTIPYVKYTRAMLFIIVAYTIANWTEAKLD